jgi:uncharacterized RDD family membrane protein YckC
VINIPGAGPVPLADLGRRFLARLIDTILIGIPLVILILLLGGLFGGNTIGASFLNGLLLVALTAGYEIVMIGSRGATVGKQLMGIKVVNIDTGALPGNDGAFKRWGVLLGPAVIPCIGGVATLVVMLSPLFDSERRQGWHDKVARTAVVAVK